MRFVMSNRRSGKFHEAEKRASRDAMAMALTQLSPGLSLASQSTPADDLARQVVVFDADPSEVQAKAQRFGPDVLVEPELLHYPTPTLGLRLFGSSDGATTFATGTGNTLRLKVTGSGAPLAQASVSVTFRGSGSLRTRETRTTDAQGRATFSYNNLWQPAVAVIAPYAGHWTMVSFAPVGELTVECPPLGPGPLGWWHRALGQTQFRKTRGRGIRVGVIDTGCGPHPALAHATLAGAFVNGQALPAVQTADVDSHGSHVCGTIGARPAAAGQHAGLAPAATLVAARVFPDADSGANQGDIANAIDALSKVHRVDLINMSLGTPPGSPPSMIEQDAVIDALERGTLCVVAAGNDGVSTVAYPSRFEPCVSVSAIGQLGVGPAGSLAALRVPNGQADRFGNDNLYLANFSNFGVGLDLCGPGVGVVATVPARHGQAAPFAVMDGTSMASPAVTGALAARLGADSAYKQLPRDLTRAARARQVLRDMARDIGLAFQYQGGGMPRP
jgi:Subtilase family